MRGVFRSTWFSTLMALWYALVAMPVLPALSFGAPRSALDTSCVTVCSCTSCSGGDACCCAADAGHAAVVHVAPETDDGCPSWRPVDCAPKAAWMMGLKAPTIAPSVGVISESHAPAARTASIDEQAMPADPIGVPEPPPRTIA